MKILLYILLWVSIYIIAISVDIFLGNFLDEFEISRVFKALIKSLSTGGCTAIGFALHSKIKLSFKQKQNNKED